MKKIYRIFWISLTALLIFNGCEKINEKPSDNNGSQASSEAAPSETIEEEQIEPTLAERERTVDTDKEFVFDDSKLLSTSDYNKINEYAAWLSKTFKINCAVVIAENLGGKSAAEYAENYYKKLYKSSNGIMFLINNDTGNDYILRKGAPAHFISDSDIEMLFTEISPLLVTGNYTDAVSRTFELFELSLPEFAIDRTNNMKKEEIIEINSMLSEACGNGESLSIIFTSNTENKKISDYAKEQYEKYYTTDSDSVALMVVNTSNAEYDIRKHGSFAAIEVSQESIKDLIAGCLTETEGKKSFSCRNAADIFIKFMGK